jgi:hypothetical protein
MKLLGIITVGFSVTYQHSSDTGEEMGIQLDGT